MQPCRRTRTRSYASSGQLVTRRAIYLLFIVRQADRCSSADGPEFSRFAWYRLQRTEATDFVASCAGDGPQESFSWTQSDAERFLSHTCAAQPVSHPRA